MKARYFVIFFLLLTFISCKKDKEHAVDFYYWKSDVSFGETEQKYFKELNSEKLYIRFFDVDKTDNKILPQAKIRIFNPKTLNAEYVPVVFITNRTFTGISEEGLEESVKNVNDLINIISRENSVPQVKEIQIDCDWTKNTRFAYFEFLKKLKTLSGKKISCTIRLHQIAYKKDTGVPPADKGYLMCYATSQPTEFTERNSILDMSLLKSYTKNINDYPLDFDIALPLYLWAVVTNHLGEIKLINNATREELEAEDHFKPIDENKYEVVDDFFFHGLYLNKGFKIKVEDISPDLLKEAKTYLNDKIERDYRIVYYHLDKPFLERFTVDDLK